MPESQPAIGESVDVRVPKPGGTGTRLLGQIVMEDLTEVLQHISSRTGRSGPQGPLTQLMLKRGALQLADRLGLTRSPASRAEKVIEHGPLSSLIGHQRFVEQTLGLSWHNMERRWPIASDWYTDLIAYILRPERYQTGFDLSGAEITQWFGLSLGDFVRACVRQQLDLSHDLALYRLADSVKWLWPTHPAVQAAHHEEITAAAVYWGPLYEEFLRIYDLRLRDGVTIHDYVWTLFMLVTAEAHERTLLADRSPFGTPASRPTTARSAVFFIAGTVETPEGKVLTLSELDQRMPVHFPRVELLQCREGARV